MWFWGWWVESSLPKWRTNAPDHHTAVCYFCGYGFRTTDVATQLVDASQSLTPPPPPTPISSALRCLHGGDSRNQYCWWQPDLSSICWLEQHGEWQRGPPQDLLFCSLDWWSMKSITYIPSSPYTHPWQPHSWSAAYLQRDCSCSL